MSTKKIKAGLVVLMMAVLATVGFTSTSTQQVNDKTTAKGNFVYYPKANVYFNKTDGSYTFLDEGGRVWQTTKSLPEAVQTGLDKNISLGVISQPVWQNNQQHRMVGAVALYAAADDFKEKPKPVIEQKPKAVMPKSTTNEPAVAEVETEKKVKGFFRRLFGKKDKKEKEQ